MILVQSSQDAFPLAGPSRPLTVADDIPTAFAGDQDALPVSHQIYSNFKCQAPAE